MKSISIQVAIVFMAIGIGCVFGDGEDEARNCTLPEDRFEDGYPSNMDQLSFNISKCLFERSDMILHSAMALTNNTEEIREVAKTYCQGFPLLSTECTNKVTTLAEDCLNTTQLSIYKSKRDFFFLELEEGCLDDGKFFGDFFTVVIDLNRTINRNIHEECNQIAYNTLGGDYTSDPAEVSKNLFLYYTYFKNCFIQKLGDVNIASENIETHMNRILNKIKCISDVNGSIVDCHQL